ncbi:hypothetical protein AAFF_G00241440 [Aldrovandia affinis]|uniref:Uncharacterized protein n=1 Tax=Aldrovandia affinis TaxID=143900 RepID=A0AAD7WU47_9TELE|nr:hypothetical protein AAFF_G00241440 [Aldrovandia affinis]
MSGGTPEGLYISTLPDGSFRGPAGSSKGNAVSRASGAGSGAVASSPDRASLTESARCGLQPTSVTNRIVDYYALELLGHLSDGVEGIPEKCAMSPTAFSPRPR